MQLRISKFLAENLGETKLRTVGLEWNARSYHDFYTLDLSSLTKPQIKQLREWLEEEAALKTRGAKVLIRDIDVWNKAMVDAGAQRARTVNQFSSLLTEYLRKAPGHRLYKRIDDEGKAHLCYYVNMVEYHPEQRQRDSWVPASTEMRLLFYELGGRVETSVTFHSENIQGMTASEALAKAGYYLENKRLRDGYLKETQQFNAVSPLVGQQYIATGRGTDDLDGNTRARFGTTTGYLLFNTKVVVDVFYEDDKERRQREGHLNLTFWARKTPKVVVVSESDGMDEREADLADRDGILTEIEIPVHPFCAVFDLRRHLRLRVHINYLTEYKYDQDMDAKLILPEVTKNLIATLIQQSHAGFADIIEGKGQGVPVLLGGPPGVGKTLTAEVFAEASEKPLYSIQAAQLGIKADQVEANITKFLSRGSRWDAIVLIDEADVYIRARDKDMEHNAIVAAFLRVLEYQTTILFLTTNRASIVDDAIISRCIARINYENPTQDEQAQIWRVLADLNDIPLSDSTIETNIERHPHLAGRDIKQLLKLASVYTATTGNGITPDTIDFVAQFQPTIDIGQEG